MLLACVWLLWKKLQMEKLRFAPLWWRNGKLKNLPSTEDAVNLRLGGSCIATRLPALMPLQPGVEAQVSTPAAHEERHGP
jgi:hypothetical protein